MERLLLGNQIFELLQYTKEDEFERHIVKNACEIFGPRAVYIDIKKRIGKDNILTIPDGYLIDFSFSSAPRLYIIENELVTHDPYRHVGQQLLKFAISYKASGRSIKKFLLESILRDNSKKETIEKWLEAAGYRNVDDLLEDLIYEKPVAAIIIIDEINSDLENVVNQLSMKIDIIEFKSYLSGSEIVHKFTPFQQELREITETDIPQVKPEELDTIVVPANVEGFEEVFLGEDCWYSIRISSSMIDRIKYIAGYQTSPISAVTYYAEVSKIEKHKNTGKYIVHFVDKAKKIGPIKLTSKKRGAAPQGPRYTTFKRLKKAKTLADLF